MKVVSKMDVNILNEIKKVENKVGQLSNTQKILLATDGSVTTILDVLDGGKINIKTTTQEFQKADENIANLLGISKGDTINYRVVIIGRNKPLIHAVSYIPVKRLNNNFKEDLIRADIPIGRILKKYNIESRREIKSIGIENSTPELKDIFNTDSIMITRTYNIIHKDSVLIRIKETFPYSLFKGY
ncbi:MAG: chorismate pyruvate-lyase family protein [Methanomicrobiales archaeon]